MEKITTDISSFENLRRDGYVYVDKTDFLLAAGRQQGGTAVLHFASAVR